MKIRVKLLVNLRQYGPKGENGNFELDCSSEQTIGSLIELIKIPASVRSVILLNGRHTDEGTKLFDGDTVTIYPPIAGG